MTWTWGIATAAERAAVFDFPQVLLLVAGAVGSLIFLVLWWRAQDDEPDDR
ncbi:hypothetical protein [Nocardioides sp. cx-173]|uniref:hypothetical protein n=1 Tax=Nocardioides sp. cx-173 TaxID=2898796 RepID=UPI001E2AC25A|nr:hypothetical protein [Nocardioides sp. cx-173]MCD4527460.1 hypothetical protein [Nocardioides sp. cx-173]UGB40400.1 hypothetical protein LQ940_13540 [Nocardioides sp. cx-173]